LPGRVGANETTFTSQADLAAGLRRAAVAHGEHEKRTGAHDANWPDWHADYIVREQSGQQLPDSAHTHKLGNRWGRNNPSPYDFKTFAVKPTPRSDQ
jgi:hypothetical protein